MLLGAPHSAENMVVAEPAHRGAIQSGSAPFQCLQMLRMFLSMLFKVCKTLQRCQEKRFGTSKSERLCNLLQPLLKKTTKQNKTFVMFEMPH